jgi:hypothetical protein
MYSTRSVGSCFKRTRRSVGQSFSLRATHRRTQVPAPCVSSRGPGGNRTCLAMYSTTAVERVFICLKRTDEGMAREQRRTASGALRYATATCAGGTCTHITRSNVLRTGSRSVFNGRRGYGQSNALSLELRPAGLAKIGTDGLEPTTDVLQPAVAFLFLIKAQRSCYRDVSFSVNVVPACSWACTMTIQRGKRFRRSSS